MRISIVSASRPGSPGSLSIEAFRDSIALSAPDSLVKSGPELLGFSSSILTAPASQSLISANGGRTAGAAANSTRPLTGSSSPTRPLTGSSEYFVEQGTTVARPSTADSIGEDSQIRKLPFPQIMDFRPIAATSGGTRMNPPKKLLDNKKLNKK